jgi:hypothetical protein
VISRSPALRKSAKGRTLKPRVCKCGKAFTPRSGLQRACSQPCALKLVRERAAKKVARARRANTRAAKEGIKTKPMLMKEAQREFNHYIRVRDLFYPCISCGRLSKADHLTGGSIDCGHYRSVGAAPELRFDEDNAHGQCKHCNKYKSGNAVDYRMGLKMRIGIGRVEQLEGKHEMPNWSRDDLRNIRDHYRARAREYRRPAA